VISRVIHFIVPGPLKQQTGGYIYDAKVISGLRHRGWKVVTHCLEGTFPDVDEVARRSLSTLLTSLPDKACVAVDELAMAGLPDVVVAQRERLYILAIVHLLLTDDTELTIFQRERLVKLERRTLLASSGVVATSEYTASRILALGVNHDCVRVVLPGTDPAPQAEGVFSTGAPQILCLASVTPRKGQDVLVHALTQLNNLSWSCICAGSLSRDPFFVAHVEELVFRSNLADRIVFPGECDSIKVNALYAASAVFVLPSYSEGYGMVLTEAMARGLPIISTTGGAIPHTVPSDAALLVSAGDQDALAQALKRVLDDQTGYPNSAFTLRGKLSKAGRTYAAGLPDWNQTIGKFADTIIELTTES
tara:strand:- start:309 stop:1397 length:1089 start_codon:yes stop_codon:yes gene_type:complete